MAYGETKPYKKRGAKKGVKRIKKEVRRLQNGLPYPEWCDEYFKRLSDEGTPVKVCRELGIKYECVKWLRRDNEKFREAEEEANELYEERFYSEMMEAVRENPMLMVKVGEKILKRMNRGEGNIVINDNRKNLTVLGIDKDSVYENTQKMLELFSREKIGVGNAGDELKKLGSVVI